MVAHGRTVVSLPLLTKVGDHTKRTECLACVDAYQTLPDRMLAMLKPLVILDWSTNCYQSPDLGQTLPQETFTNHYHRTDDITHSGLDYVLCRVITD